jgi:hypothetical protein
MRYQQPCTLPFITKQLLTVSLVMLIRNSSELLFNAAGEMGGGVEGS